MLSQSAFILSCQVDDKEYVVVGRFSIPSFPGVELEQTLFDYLHLVWKSISKLLLQNFGSGK